MVEEHSNMVETVSEVKVKEKDEVERLLKNLKNMSLTALRRECQTNPPKGFNMKLNAKELRKMLKRKYLKEFPELAVKVFKEKDKPKIETTVDYLVVIDFECTCDRTDPDDKHSREPYLHEIIEFPVVIVDVSKKAIIAEFRKFVKPKVNPILSEFCLQLTGVTQKDVDGADSFPVVLDSFQTFLKTNGLNEYDGELNYLIVTDGINDVARFFQTAISSHDLEFPSNFCQVADIRQIVAGEFRSPKSIKFFTLEKLVTKAGVKFEGKAHCGIDDSRNIARMIIHLLEKDVGFYMTHLLVKQEEIKLFPKRCHYKPHRRNETWYKDSTYGVVNFKYKDIEKQVHKACDFLE